MDEKEKGEPIQPTEIAGYGRVEDSRLKGYGNRVTHPIWPLERTFCTKCGAPFGWVSEESSKYIQAAEVVVFCNDCEAKMNKLGPIPLQQAAPDNAVEIPPPPNRRTV
jgi:hypothetical protein